MAEQICGNGEPHNLCLGFRRGRYNADQGEGHSERGGNFKGMLR